MVLIVVLWMMIGLVAIVLTFAESMRMEYRGSFNSTAAIEAGQSVEGARRYLTYILANSTTPGVMPTPDPATLHPATLLLSSATGLTYKTEAVPIGDTAFWVIGRADQNLIDADMPVFGLVDEASKLNINTATVDMLELLPNMTPDFAQAIVDWRGADASGQGASGGTDVYGTNNPPYQCKQAPFESVDELRLIYGATWDILYGSDTNRNGVIDPDERAKQGNGTLMRGILDCVTVYSKQSNVRSNGQPRLDVRTPLRSNPQLTSLLQQRLGTGRASQIEAALQGSRAVQSVLEFYIVGGVNFQEAVQLENSLTADTGPNVIGKVNVSTALREVLVCLPGIGDSNADALIAARQGKTPDQMASVAWVTDVLDRASAIQAGPYITAQSYQYGADVVSVGPGGHAFRRSWMIFDTSGKTPVVTYRCDWTYLGWPLGTQLRADLDSQPSILGNSQQ